MASIVLLMDACVNGTGSLQDEIRYGEVPEALRMLEDARSHSLATVNLLESLTQVLEKHRAQQQISRVSAPLQLGRTSTAPPTSTTPVIGVATAQIYQRPDTLSFAGTPNPVDTNKSSPMGAVPDQMPVMTGQSSYGNQLAQSLRN
ncbi:hypothetical protein BDV32DRAFT_150075 [Aspergillus pseudonomiae]|nr:hypothetical protein BDV32DRAFT_150075 [Aspergillus pseudonomiae]